jgi:hypothetical protein
MPAWPASLPQYAEISGYQEKPRKTVIRSATDIGAKQRRRATAAPQPVTLQVLLTQAQRATFVAFHQADLQDGSLSFTWVHPVTRAACTMRLVEGDYDLRAAGGKYFALTLPLEILP